MSLPLALPVAPLQPPQPLVQVVPMAWSVGVAMGAPVASAMGGVFGLAPFSVPMPMVTNSQELSSRQPCCGENSLPAPAVLQSKAPLHTAEVVEQNLQKEAAVTATADAKWSSALSTLGQDGPVGSCPDWTSVRSTFIHAALPPPTPPTGSAQIRSRSLPKNSGSNRDQWGMAVHALSFAPRKVQDEETTLAAKPSVDEDELDASPCKKLRSSPFPCNTPSPQGPLPWRRMQGYNNEYGSPSEDNLSFAELLRLRVADRPDGLEACGDEATMENAQQP